VLSLLAPVFMYMHYDQISRDIKVTRNWANTSYRPYVHNLKTPSSAVPGI